MEIILDSYGTFVQMKNKMLFIKLQDKENIYVPLDKLSTLVIFPGVRITSDVLFMLMRHQVDVVLQTRKSNVEGRIERNLLGSVSANRRNQLEFFYSKKSVDWIKELVAYKMNSQSALLLMLENEDEEANLIASRAINAIADQKSKVLRLDGEIITDIAPSLRGWEASASRRYIEAVSAYLPAIYRFENHSRHGEMAPFNALINYGYGLLHGKVEGALMKAGLAPYIGCFHRDAHNRPALIYDVMERYKVWVDYVAIDLCRQEALKKDCFTENNGTVWLTTLGRRIYIQALKDYLGEMIRINQLECSREGHINHYTQYLSKIFSDL